MKVNYDLKFQEELKKIGTSKPSLLLHVCCGPCSSNILKELAKVFNITIYYSNSNIYPAQEYQRRFNELIDFLKILNQELKTNIQVIEHDYHPQEYLDQISVFAQEKEGGKRCHLCYGLRMRDAWQYASDHRFDYWTTVLSVSRFKNSQWINQIGESFVNQNTKFLYADFKKHDGFNKSIQTASQYNLYRQEYCGCIYSYQEMLKREKTKKKPTGFT